MIVFDHPILTWWALGCLVTAFSWYTKREQLKAFVGPSISRLGDSTILVATVLCLALAFDAFLWPMAFTGWYWEQE